MILKGKSSPKNKLDNKKTNISILKSKKGLYAFGSLLAVLVLILTFTFTNSSILNKSFATGNGWEWNGYDTIDTAYTEHRGFNNGYFFINLFKGDTKFISATFKLTKSVSGSNNTHGLYTTIETEPTSWYFDYNGTGSGDYESWVQVGASSSTAYATRASTPISTENDGYYEYAAPTIKIKVPKGYYFSSYSTGYDSVKFTKKAVLLPIYCPSTPYISGDASRFDDSACYTSTDYGTMLYADSPNVVTNGGNGNQTFTAKASDTWTSGGRLFINVPKSTGVTTRRGQNTGYTDKYYRTRESYSVKFLPNKTTITFDANGGSGGPSTTQTKTYDSTLTLSDLKPTKNDMNFSKWCTNADGTGTCFGSGEVLAKDIWPSTQAVTLYAKYSNQTPSHDEWCGYTIDGSYSSTPLGWTDGKGAIHLGKCDVTETDINNCTGYSTTVIKSVLDFSGAPQGSLPHYTYQNQHSVNATFSIESGNTSNFTFVNNTVSSKTSSLNGNTSSSYVYLEPNVKVKPPKGYKFWKDATPYPDDLWTSGNSEFSIRNSSGTFTFESMPGPYNGDTWISGILSLNNVSIGHRTQDGYRVYKSYCLAFKPNTRTIVYDKNDDGEYSRVIGYMPNDTYVYSDDSESGFTIRASGYSKDGFGFLGWNTEEDGSGTWYEEGQKIPGNMWPDDSSNLVLYAQWGEVNSATIYYIGTNDGGSKEIKTASVQCVVKSGDSCSVRIPQEVIDSSGTSNNEYIGLASRTGTMSYAKDAVNTSQDIDSSVDTINLTYMHKFYALYSSNVTNYYNSN